MKQKRLNREPGVVPVPLALAAEIDKLVGLRNRNAFAVETIRRYLEERKNHPTLALPQETER